MAAEIHNQPIQQPDPKPVGSVAAPRVEEALATEVSRGGTQASGTSVSSELAPSDSSGPFLLRVRDQALLATASGIALVAMVAYCVRTSNWGAEPIELERQPEHLLDYKIDLNAATWVEWSQLPGIGPVLANRIVHEREHNGPFRDLEDLSRVKGIGPKKIEAIRPFVQEEPPGGAIQPVSGGSHDVGPTKAP